jgi:hypothetical protein
VVALITPVKLKGMNLSAELKASPVKEDEENPATMNMRIMLTLKMVIKSPSLADSFAPNRHASVIRQQMTGAKKSSSNNASESASMRDKVGSQVKRLDSSSRMTRIRSERLRLKPADAIDVSECEWSSMGAA